MSVSAKLALGRHKRRAGNHVTRRDCEELRTTVEHRHSQNSGGQHDLPENPAANTGHQEAKAATGRSCVFHVVEIGC